jgi:site-specific recombinase xerD
MRSTFKVLFYLKKNKHKIQSVVPVMGRITVNGTIAQFSAKLSVPPHLWEVKGGRAKGKSLEADRINRYLDNIRIQIGKHYQSICDRDGYVSADKVKNAYLGFSKRYKLLLELCDEFCKEYKNRIDVDRTIHSLFRYQTLRRDLSLFICQDYKVKDIPLVELDQSFAEKFAAYLKHVRGLADTTISVEIKSLKHIVKKAFNDGQMEKNPFAYYYYFADQPEIEYLTEEEINKLIIGKVKQQRQDRTRDMFLFCCFTGLSYADLAKLSYEELKQTPNGAWWISSIRQKTKVPFTVKLLPVAKAILEKYRIPANRFNRLFPENPGKVFPVASLKSSDASLKHIARQCGIAKNLKFHTARHTFATTVSLMNGIPLETVSKMLGHKYTTTTQIYAKVTNQMIGNAISRIEDKIGDRFQFPTLKEESDG